MYNAPPLLCPMNLIHYVLCTLFIMLLHLFHYVSCTFSLCSMHLICYVLCNFLLGTFFITFYAPSSLCSMHLLQYVICISFITLYAPTLCIFLIMSYAPLSLRSIHLVCYALCTYFITFYVLPLLCSTYLLHYCSIQPNTFFKTWGEIRAMSRMFKHLIQPWRFLLQ